eukprot:TRINITY_DN797_c0_g1_i2.p1 TRINITY_DN797_c0_g1~~TRINITY_DN797_c0_g1_i2.p1  ORF type:complete len:616 (-),score=142.23 TRINITY_DN797_c0_g1_i2:57-1904(-)
MEVLVPVIDRLSMLCSEERNISDIGERDEAARISRMLAPATQQLGVLFTLLAPYFNTLDLGPIPGQAQPERPLTFAPVRHIISPSGHITIQVQNEPAGAAAVMPGMGGSPFLPHHVGQHHLPSSLAGAGFAGGISVNSISLGSLPLPQGFNPSTLDQARRQLEIIRQSRTIGASAPHPRIAAPPSQSQGQLLQQQAQAQAQTQAQMQPPQDLFRALANTLSQATEALQHHGVPPPRSQLQSLPPPPLVPTPTPPPVPTPTPTPTPPPVLFHAKASAPNELTALLDEALGRGPCSMSDLLERVCARYRIGAEAGHEGAAAEAISLVAERLTVPDIISLVRGDWRPAEKLHAPMHEWVAAHIGTAASAVDGFAGDVLVDVRRWIAASSDVTMNIERQFPLFSSAFSSELTPTVTNLLKLAIAPPGTLAPGTFAAALRCLWHSFATAFGLTLRSTFAGDDVHFFAALAAAVQRALDGIVGAETAGVAAEALCAHFVCYCGSGSAGKPESVPPPPSPVPPEHPPRNAPPRPQPAASPPPLSLSALSPLASPAPTPPLTALSFTPTPMLPLPPSLSALELQPPPLAPTTPTQSRRAGTRVMATSGDADGQPTPPRKRTRQ